MKRESGFTLIELLIVVAVIGILASLGVMNMLRARSSANEASAIGSLRTITSGQIVYSSSCGNGYFAVALPTLAAHPPQSPIPFLSPDLTLGNVVPKSGYNLSVRASATGLQIGTDCNGILTFNGYYAQAEPITFGTSGSRSFATLSPTNVIWQTTTGTAPGEPFGAPAVIVQ